MTESGAHFCGQCGTALEPGAHFCPSCGAPVHEATGAGPAEPTQSMRSTPPSGPPPLPPPGAHPQPEGGGRPRWLWPAVAGALALALIVIGVLFLLGDDEAEAGEIFLEPAGEPGEDPFAEGLAEPVVSTTSSTTTAPPTTVEGGAVQSVSGGNAGLYGGTGSSARCDREGMIAFLEANPDKARAFVEALNRDPTLRWSGGTTVSVTELPDYIRELTPVTLTRDTRVTNHGYRNGSPTPRQSVIQAGTAVLVDRYGVPRAKCACGNPLIRPARVQVTPRYTGPRWPGFNPATIVVVNQVDVEIDVFVLVDLETGELFERPAGTTGENDRPVEPDEPEPTTTTAPPTTAAPPPPPPPQEVPDDLGGGDVQVTLTWVGDADLDLYVTDPEGTEIYYGNRTSPSGGELDVDTIPSGGDTGPHVENVFWPSGSAPSGQYSARVESFGSASGQPAEFSLQVQVRGELVQVIDGALGEFETSESITFSV